MAKSNKMNIKAAARIAKATARRNGGKIPKGSFASVADARAKKNELIQPTEGKVDPSKP